jgi:hypothetical protein
MPFASSGQFPTIPFLWIRCRVRREYHSRRPSPQTHGYAAVVSGEWKAEAASPLRRSILLCVLLGVLIFGWLKWRDASSRRQPGETTGPIINKEPVHFTNRTFDPAAPPADMPPMRSGEYAVCDSNFLSSASVGGDTRQTDATHGTVTITRVKVTLQLNITIWAPAGATQHVMEHEEGHRQISEFYYQAADQRAGQIAANYLGKQVEFTGANSDTESTRMLEQMAHEITEEYNKELDPEPTQLLYDTITDHGRNAVVVQDAVAHALKNVAIESN